MGGAVSPACGRDSLGNMHLRNHRARTLLACNAPVFFGQGTKSMKLHQPTACSRSRPHKTHGVLWWDTGRSPTPSDVSLSALFALLPGQHDSLSRTAGSLQGGTNKRSVSIAAGASLDYGGGARFLVRARGGGGSEERSRPGQQP